MPAADPLSLALRAGVDLPPAVERARDDFLASQLGRDDRDLVAAWETVQPASVARPAAVAMLARRGLVRASLLELSSGLPRGLAGFLIESGRWSPGMALAFTRTPYGGFDPDTLASLAPHLDAAQARAALAIVAQRCFIDEVEDAQGIAAVVARLVALEGPAAIEPAIAAFSPPVRALVAAFAWPTWPRDILPLAARWVAEGAHQIRHCSHAAGAALGALPLFGEAERVAIVKRALDRLYDEDFGLDCEHAALLGAAGLWSYGWDDGARDTLPYPRAQMLAHVVPHLPPERRAEGYALWLDAHRAALVHHTWGLAIPERLPDATFGEVLAIARAAASAEGRALTMIALAYQRLHVIPEAIAAARALSGVNGALARLALLPVAVEIDRAPLAAESADTMVALLDEGMADALREGAQHWPRGPQERRWCYLSSLHRGRAVLAAPLAWMSVEERGRRAEALLARSCRAGDRSILAAAGAAVALVPEAARAAWIERLTARAVQPGTHPVALAAVLALAPAPRRAELALAAWRTPRIGPDEGAVSGAALVRASRWLDPVTRASVQIQALERWSVVRHPYQWTALLQALLGCLEPEAFAWARARASSTYDVAAILPALPEGERQREADALVERHTGGSFFWQHTHALKLLYPLAPNAGPRVLASIDGWRAHGLPFEREAVSLATAWALDPITASGARDRAEALWGELATPEAQCIGDLALARHMPEGRARDARIDAALARLEGIAVRSEAGEVWEAVLRWIPPGRDRRRALALAERLDGDPWLAFARAAEEHGARDELAEQLTAARIRAITPEGLVASGLGLDLWAHALDAPQAFACWRHYWREERDVARRWGAVRALGDMVPVAVRAGGPGAAEALAAAVLEVSDWFP